MWKAFISELALIFSTSKSHKPSKKLNTSRWPISAAIYNKVSPASFCIDISSEMTPSDETSPMQFFSCSLSPSRSPHRTALKMAWWVMKVIALESIAPSSSTCTTKYSTFTSCEPCCVWGLRLIWCEAKEIETEREARVKEEEKRWELSKWKKDEKLAKTRYLVFICLVLGWWGRVAQRMHVSVSVVCFYVSIFLHFHNLLLLWLFSSSKFDSSKSFH